MKEVKTKEIKSEFLDKMENLKDTVKETVKTENSGSTEPIKTKDTLNFKLVDNLQMACEKSLEVTETLNHNIENLLNNVDFSEIRLINYEKMMKTVDKINAKLDEIKKLI